MAFRKIFTRAAAGVGLQPDVERDVHGWGQGDWIQPTDEHPNLDRFRIMVGITTAASMTGPRRPTGARVPMAPKAFQANTAPTTSANNGITTPGPYPPDPNIFPPTNIPLPGEIRSQRESVIPSNSSMLNGPKSNPELIFHRRPAENTGIYQIVCEKGSRSRVSYRWASIIINMCLALQLVVAAALTAIGATASAGNGSVTVLGAINTVIAGFLTYLKGSGLPGKTKYFQHEWDKIRDYIEARERDLQVHDNAFDVNDQVSYIRYMFEEVKKDIENNRSDRFASPGALNSMPETAVIQNMQKKKIVELGKAVMGEIKEVVTHHEKHGGEGTSKGIEAGEKGEGMHEAKHEWFQDIVKALAAEAEPIKKAVHEHDEEGLKRFFDGLLRKRQAGKEKEREVRSRNDQSGLH